MSGTGSGRHTVASTGDEALASRTSAPSRQADERLGRTGTQRAAQRRRPLERALPMPADRHE
jgi:hypothetical protein